METQTSATPSLETITRAVTNDPMLSENIVTLGSEKIVILDLPYDDYITFLSLLKPFLHMFAGSLSTEFGLGSMATDNMTAANLLSYCADSLPEMAWIVVKQTRPELDIEDIKKLAKTPFKMAGIVVAQVNQNKMIQDIADFFGQILPLMKKMGGNKTAPAPTEVKVRKTKVTRS